MHTNPTENEIRAFAEYHHVDFAFARDLLVQRAKVGTAPAPASAVSPDMGDQVVAQLDARRSAVPQRLMIPVSALSLTHVPDAGDHVVDALLRTRPYQGA
jgi:hypothetical protein